MVRKTYSFCFVWLSCYQKFLLVALLLILMGCAARKPLLTEGSLTLADGFYDNQPPVTEGKRDALGKIARSVVKVRVETRYRVEIPQYVLKDDTFIKDPSSPYGYRVKMEKGKPLVDRTQETVQVIGSALVFTEEGNLIGLVTCNHLVNPEEKIETYFLDEYGNPTDILASVAIKLSSSVAVEIEGVPGFQGEVLATDRGRDVAVLKCRPRFTPVLMNLLPFNFRWGNSSELTYGDFVYVFGYPKEEKRLAHGLVSSHASANVFGVDAAIRYGFSGGPVIAIRDGDPNYELVGLCKGVAASTIRVIAPHEGKATLVPKTLSLEDIYIKELKTIDYGLTYCVGVNGIKKFLLRNKDLLRQNGLGLPDFGTASD